MPVLQVVQEEIYQTFEINDVPAHIRLLMIKRNVLADIERKTNTTILVRGRFYPPGTPLTEDPPIHLRISYGQHSGTVRSSTTALLDALGARKNRACSLTAEPARAHDRSEALHILETPRVHTLYCSTCTGSHKSHAETRILSSSSKKGPFVCLGEASNQEFIS